MSVTAQFPKAITMISGLIGTLDGQSTDFHRGNSVKENGFATITNVVASPGGTGTLLDDSGDALPGFAALPRHATVAKKADELMLLLHLRPPASIVLDGAARDKIIFWNGPSPSRRSSGGISPYPTDRLGYDRAGILSLKRWPLLAAM
jgi:hypothetical protein